MKIEVGRFYKARDGRKAFIIECKDGEYLGAIKSEDSATGYWGQRWQEDGVCKELGASKLVSEWEEPKPRLKAYLVKEFNPTDNSPAGYTLRLGRGDVELGENLLRPDWIKEFDEPEEEK